MDNPTVSVITRPKLSGIQRLCFGVGHVLNDLCASMWFSYLLVFFHKVLLFSNELSGYVMLLGQIADAIATPLVGFESDRTRGCGNYGQRKSWHLLGCICVLASFPFIFMECFGCENSDDWAKFIYYAPFVVIFQFGWATTQNSHLSLIPELADRSETVELNAISDKEREDSKMNERALLTSIRYAFTVMSSIYVYSMAWLLLGTTDDDLGDQDLTVFKLLSLIVVGTGAVFVFIFHVGLKEKPKNYDALHEPASSSSGSGQEEAAVAPPEHGTVHVSVTDWLREPQFYQVGVMYMCTRLVVNVSQIYMPMFLTDSLTLPKNYIAIVPLIVFVSGFLTSLIMPLLHRLLGRKACYHVGVLVVAGACWWMYFLGTDTQLQIIGATILLGAGNSALLITSTTIVSDLIDKNTSSGAWVYGAMSFTDKLSNGIAIVLIQHLQPCPDVQVCCDDCVWYYRNVMTFVPFGIAIVGSLAIVSLWKNKIGDLNMFKGRSGSNSSTSETAALLAAEYNETKALNGDSADCCSYWFCFTRSADSQALAVTPRDPAEETAAAQRRSSRVSGYGATTTTSRAAAVEQSPAGSVHHLSHEYLSGGGRGEEAAVPATPPPSFVPPAGGLGAWAGPAEPSLSPSQLVSGLERLVKGGNGRSDGEDCKDTVGDGVSTPRVEVNGSRNGESVSQVVAEIHQGPEHV